MTDDWWRLLLYTNDDYSYIQTTTTLIYKRRLLRTKTLPNNESVYHFHVGRWVISCCRSLFLSFPFYLFSNEWMNESSLKKVVRSIFNKDRIMVRPSHITEIIITPHLLASSRSERHETRNQNPRWPSPPPRTLLLHMHMVHSTYWGQ